MSKILLIEPDKLLGEAYKAALDSQNHEVVVCAGAQLAVFIADKFQPDLVIVELQLVEHSGIEFLYEFRSYVDWQIVPIIILTQVPPSEFNQSIDLLKTDLSISEYLYKPQVNLKKLINTVTYHLQITAT